MSTSNTRVALRICSLAPRWFEAFYPYSMCICRSGIEDHVELPNDITEIDLVFTKRKYKASFEMVNGQVIGVWHLITHSARIVALELYNEGARYVHVEY